jgi:hypothetical protein
LDAKAIETLILSFQMLNSSGLYQFVTIVMHSIPPSSKVSDQSPETTLTLSNLTDLCLALNDELLVIDPDFNFKINLR